MPRVMTTALGVGDGPHLKILTDAGFEVAVPAPGLNLWKEDHLIACLEDAEAVIAGSEPYTRRVLQSLPKLRVIARRGVGFDAIDLAAADACDVVVTTTPGTLHHAVAEHTLALLLGVVRGFPRLDQQVRSGKWHRVPTPRLMGKTLGIVGLGQIGQAVAWRAAGLGLRVWAYDPNPNRDFAQQFHVTYTDLDTLLAGSDFVSLHLPMLPEFKGFFDKTRFARMRRGAYFINTARGPLVNEADLVAALHSGHLAGAGLDVFEKEPLPLDSPLLKLDNVLLSGHVAGMDQEANDDIAIMFAQTIVSLYRGEWPQAAIRNLRGCKDWSWHKRQPRK